MASVPNEPRDLLAERIRRLEARIGELDATLAHTGEGLARVTGRLDALVDLVGRLGRVIDVQGTTLHGGETQLEQRVGSIAERVDAIGGSLAEVLDGLARIQRRLGRAAGDDAEG